MMHSKTYEVAVADCGRGGRIHELHALRGLAAVVVVIYHAILYYDYGGAIHRNLGFVLNGHAAVVGFFVLSGFVLTLALMRNAPNGGASARFLVGRAFRIYPALWLGCLAGMMYLVFLGSVAMPGASAWAIENFAAHSVAPREMVLTFAGLKTTLPLPIWSLSVELAASLLMPLIVWTMSRSLGAFIIVMLASIAIASLGIQRPMLMPIYLVNFVFGAAIALLAPHWRRMAAHRYVSRGVLVAGVVLFWGGRRFAGADVVLAYHHGATTILEGLGAALLIGAVYVRQGGVAWLRVPTLTRLGDYSYSIYVLHQPILGVICLAVVPMFRVGSTGAAIGLAAISTLLATMAAAALSFRFVERPAIRIGKQLMTIRRRHAESNLVTV